MPLPFADLTLRRLAVHEVFVRDTDRAPIAPRCSTNLAALGVDGLRVIRDRLLAAIGSDARRIEMVVSEDGPGSTFYLASALHGADDGEFVRLSQQIAARLADAQSSRSIPGGIVVVLDGTVGLDRKPFAAVIKAEMTDGFIKEDVEGGPFIRYLAELLLTPQQKFHKIGMYVRDSEVPAGESCGDDYHAFVFDATMRASAPETAANYFYEAFLGCRVAPTSQRLVRDFFLATRRFLDEAELEPEDRVELGTALNVYLRSQRETIQVMEFAEKFLPDELHDSYSRAMEAGGVPDSAIVRDTTLIKRHLRTRRLKFSTDVRVIAPAEKFAELVQVQHQDAGDGWTTILIRGTLVHQE